METFEIRMCAVADLMTCCRLEVKFLSEFLSVGLILELLDDIHFLARLCFSNINR